MRFLCKLFRAFDRMAILIRRCILLVRDYRANESSFEDDENIGFGQNRVAFIRIGSYRSYNAMYRFRNHRGALISRGSELGSPWIIIPISFIRLMDGSCWYYTFMGGPEEIKYSRNGYKRVQARLQKLKEMSAPVELALTEYFRVVPEGRRESRMKWFRNGGEMPENLSHSVETRLIGTNLE